MLNATQHPTRTHLWITPDGRVFEELTAGLASGGYHTVHPHGGEQGTIRRHTLVCETFHGPRPSGQEVRHYDGDPGNDHPSNLLWGTRKENMADMVRHERSLRGARNMQAKVTQEQVTEIRTRRAAGESGKALADEFGLTQAAICDMVKRRTWEWLP